MIEWVDVKENQTVEDVIAEKLYEAVPIKIINSIKNKKITVGFVSVADWRKEYIDKVVKPECFAKLKEVEDFVLADVWEDLSEFDKQNIKMYRKDLRNLPDSLTNLVDPSDIEWPEKPNKVKSKE